MEDRASGALDKLRTKLDQVGGTGAAATFTGMVAAKGLDFIADAAYGAGQAVGGFIQDSISAASDLNESMSKSSVVFGAQADQVSKWGDTAADSFGLSKRAAIEAAASFGNVFKGLNFTADESAKMSERLVALAGDLASFNNIDPTEALDKLRSGLAGEAEPLRSVGVFLTEAQVKAKAMQLGLVDAHGEMSEGAKIIARYNLILEQTKTAQGDFARTSDELANSQRKANAELEDLQAELGERMLPVQKAVTHAQIDFFEGLNLVADRISGRVTPAVLQLTVAHRDHAGAVEYAQEKYGEMDEATKEAAAALGLLTDDQVASIKETARMAEVTDYMSEHVKDDNAQVALAFQTSSDSVTKDADAMSTSISRIGTRTRLAEEVVAQRLATMVTDVQTARGALEEAATGAADAIYGPIIQRGELARINREINEAKETIASKNATKEQVADAKQRLAELNASKIQHLAALASYGDTSAADALKHQLSVLESTKNLTAEQKAEIAQLRAALALLERSYRDAAIAAERLASAQRDHALDRPGQGSHARAGGGPVWPGEWMVGEEGPERLTISADGSGYVTPLSGGGGGGGGPTTETVIPVSVYLNDEVLYRAIMRRMGRDLQWLPSTGGGLR